MQWSCNGRGATHCDKVGAAAPVLALVLVLVVAVSMYGAGFVGGVVGAVGGVVSALTLYKKLLPHNDAAGVVLRTWPRACLTSFASAFRFWCCSSWKWLLLQQHPLAPTGK